MLVYGERRRGVGTRAALAGIAQALRHVAGMPPGIERHGSLVAIFIETGGLSQGLADAAFAERGCDARSTAQDAAMDLLVRLAEEIGRSWRTGFTAPPAPVAELEVLDRMRLPDCLTLNRPEGYAFYALYPESYLEASLPLAGVWPLRVIGIRSIGTGLASLVAAATGAPRPVSVRPTGDPFRRRIELCDDLVAELVSDPAARVAIADEGPGLSGSSFGAVADALAARGVAPDRMHFFPSHAGDLGPEASAAHRQRWARARRHVVTFDDLVLRARHPLHRLESWVADIAGLPVAPLQDLSGGEWRRQRFGDEAHWPPSHVQQERRKFLLRARSGPWLLKFAGLGREGSRKLELAQRLHAAGFATHAAGYRHGFLVERWIEEARPIAPDADRARLVERLAAYIGFRASTFPAEQGASLPQLLTMARRNTALALGGGLAKHLDTWGREVAALQAGVQAVCTDNRLQPWEWLQMPDGRLLKTDALDHHAAHDLVGCQDVTWDIAGAALEFALADDQKTELCRIVERMTRRRVDPHLLGFSELCYAAFQLGHWSLATDALAALPAEANRARNAASAYAATLERLLSTG